MVPWRTIVPGCQGELISYLNEIRDTEAEGAIRCINHIEYQVMQNYGMVDIDYKTTKMTTNKMFEVDGESDMDSYCEVMYIITNKLLDPFMFRFGTTTGELSFKGMTVYGLSLDFDRESYILTLSNGI